MLSGATSRSGWDIERPANAGHGSQDRRESSGTSGLPVREGWTSRLRQWDVEFDPAMRDLITRRVSTARLLT